MGTWGTRSGGYSPKSTAEVFDHTCTSPQSGQRMVDWMSGKVRKLRWSVSRPTGTAFKVCGHWIKIADMIALPWQGELANAALSGVGSCLRAPTISQPRRPASVMLCGIDHF